MTDQTLLDWCQQEIPDFPLDTHSLDIMSSGGMCTVLVYNTEGRFTKHFVQKPAVDVIEECMNLARGRLAAAIIGGLTVGRELAFEERGGFDPNQPFDQGLMQGFNAAIEVMVAVFA